MRGLVVPDKGEDFTADPVELFFDLAFVYAFSRLVYFLVHHPTWSGAAEALLLFTILWFAWSSFTWAANAVSGNTRPARLIFLIATATSVPMGASIETALDSGGTTFAICASVIILMAIALNVVANDSSSAQYEAIVRYSIPNLLAIVFLVAGGFLEDGARVGAWLLSLAITIGTMIRAGSSEWTFRPGHFAERHGLIIIIALGEVIVAIGIAVSGSLSDADGLPTQTLWALGAAGTLACLLWWSYFDRVLPALEHKADSMTGTDRGRFGRDVYTWMHIPIVAGVIVTASATEEILLHPKDPIPVEFRVMFVAGILMFFGGISIAVARAYGIIAKERLTSVMAIAALALIGASWSGLAFLLAVDVALFVAILAEHIRIESPNTQESVASTS